MLPEPPPGVPPLASEEDVKARVLAPWLKDLGFGPSALRYETQLRVTIGKEFDITIGEPREQDKLAYPDIVCYSPTGRPLFVVEVKRDDQPLGEKARDQALSYARLLPDIAPFAVVANSKSAHVYDVVTRDEIHAVAESEYHKHGGAISIAPELRAQAERALIGFSAENLRQVCRRQNSFYMPIAETPTAPDGKQATAYEPRESASNAFGAFLESSARSFAVVGASGAGKSSFLKVLVDQVKDDCPLFYYDARLLTESLFASIVADFGWLVERDATAEQVISQLGAAAREFGTEFLTLRN